MWYWRPPKNPFYYPKRALSSTMGACIPSDVASVIPMALPVTMNRPITYYIHAFNISCAIYAIQCLWQYCRLPSLCSILFEGCNRLPWGTLFSQGFCLLLNCFWVALEGPRVASSATRGCIQALRVVLNHFRKVVKGPDSWGDIQCAMRGCTSSHGVV